MFRTLLCTPRTRDFILMTALTSKRTFASFVNVFIPIYGGRQIGGSTITQQTIKNITGDDSRDSIHGIERKIREIFRSINVEKTYTKEDILQSYLNLVPLTTQEYDIIGVQAAANFYFGKDGILTLLRQLHLQV